MGLEVTGLNRAIQNLKDRVSGRLEQAMEQMMQRVLQDAKMFCPYRTGKLYNSIYIEKVNKYTWIIGTKGVSYAWWNEFGCYTIDPEGKGTPQHPVIVKTGYHPFIRPAIWRNLKKLQGTLDALK